MTATEHLQKARDKIADPKNWCQWAYAVDEYGDECSWASSEAVAWCAIGAMGWFQGKERAYEMLQVASWKLRGRSPSGVNDLGSHADVMKMYDLAMQLSKEST